MKDRPTDSPIIDIVSRRRPEASIGVSSLVSVHVLRRVLSICPDPVYTLLLYQPGHGLGPCPPTCIPSTSSSLFRPRAASASSVPPALVLFSLPVFLTDHGMGRSRQRVPQQPVDGGLVNTQRYVVMPRQILCPLWELMCPPLSQLLYSH